MAIKYKELLQDDEVSDELLKDTKNSKEDDFLQCKCELLEDEDENDDDDDGDDDDYVELTWSEIGRNMEPLKLEFSNTFFR